MTLLIVAILLFLGLHLIRVVFPGFRASMIERMGKPVWIVLYSVGSVVTLLLLAYAFDQSRAVTGILYSPPVWTTHLTLLLMLFAMICLVAGLLPAGHIATRTKHPIVLAVKIWATSHLLANGETNSVILFVAFLAWAVILRIAMKRRERAGEATLPAFVSGRYDILAIVLGAVVWLLMIWKVHLWLIGVQPIAMG